MVHYCTCLDSAFLPRGLALYASLIRHASPFRLSVLCFDEGTRRALDRLAFPEVVPLSAEEVLGDDLHLFRDGRSRRQFYFATKSALMLHLLRDSPAGDRVTFLDGDMYCFSDPAPVHQATRDSSIALTPHRFAEIDNNTRFGIYNGGFATFTADAVGLAAASWWRERCVEACPDYPIAGLFADQKYLEQLPHSFERVMSIDHSGVNLGPWNLDRSGPYQERKGVVLAGRDPITFFHFHGVTRWAPGLYDPGWSPRRGTKILRERLYRPYLAELSRWEAISRDVMAARRITPVAPWGSTKRRPWWWRATRAAIKAITGVAALRLISIRDASRA